MFDITLLDNMTNESFIIFTTIAIILALYFVPFSAKILLIVSNSVYLIIDKTLGKK